MRGTRVTRPRSTSKRPNSLERAARGVPDDEPPLPLLLRLDRRIGDRIEQYAIVCFEFEQCASGDDASLLADSQHLLRLHFNLPVAAVAGADRVDKLLLRLALAVGMN